MTSSSVLVLAADYPCVKEVQSKRENFQHGVIIYMLITSTQSRYKSLITSSTTRGVKITDNSRQFVTIYVNLPLVWYEQTQFTHKN